MAAFNYGEFTSALSKVRSGLPMGPSSPGYLQGTANTIAKPAGSVGVLGAQTARAPMGAAPLAPQQSFAPPAAPTGPSPYDLQRQQAERVANSVFEGLDKMAGLLPGQRSELEGQINTSATLQQQGLQDQTAASSAKLQAARGDVAGRQALGVRDLASNMRNLLQAGNTYLGSRGAGDSSATRMYSEALSKEGNKGKSDLLRQANEQYTQINMKEQDVQTLANQELNSLNLWKNEQLGKVSQWYSQQLSGIQQQRNMAATAKEQAQMEILQNAQSYLQQLDQAATQYGTQLQQWATDRLSQINNVKMQMGQMGTYNPQQLVAQELQGMQSMGGAAQDPMYNPYVAKRNEELKRVQGMF